MMHYRKGENIEQELTKDELPFDDCLSKLPQQDFLWMHVRGGTKVHNVINYAKNALDKGEYRTVIWSGSGGGVVKTVSCAEILKRSYPLYQLTRMDQITIEEHWEPQMDGLEPIVAKRKVPSLHILMTLDPIDDSIEDVQKPNTTTEFWRGWGDSAQQQQQQQQKYSRQSGPLQQQRSQRSKQSRQGKGQNTETRQVLGEGEQTEGEQRQRLQRPQNSNRNRGEQRKMHKGNNVDQQQPQQLQEAPQESQQQQQQMKSRDDGQQREQQSQRHRRPKPKQRQQQQQQENQSPQAMQVEAGASVSALISSTPSTINTSPAAVEPMDF